MASDWYYSRNGQQAPGPVSSAQLKQLAAAGQLRPDDLVWKEGLPNWVPANSLKNLFPATPAAPPPAAPPPGGAFNFGPPPARGGADDVVEEIGVEALVDDEPYARRRAPGGGSSELLPQLLMRILAWDVGATHVTRGEQQQLAAAGVTGAAGQRYLAWRRAFLFAVFLATLVAAILTTVATFDKGFKPLNGFGVLSEVVNLLATFALVGLSLTAALLWSRPGMSRFLLFLGLAIGLLVPILNATLPFHWKLSIGPMRLAQLGADDFGPPGGGSGAAQAGMGMLFGAAYAYTLLPLLLGIGAGWLRGSIRVKTLLPESVLPGWLLIGGIPLYFLLTLYTFVIVDQIPSILLFLAFALVLLPPFAYLGLIGNVRRPIKRGMGWGALPVIEWVVFGCHCAGSLLLIILVIAESKMFSFLAIAGLYFEFLGTSLYATAVAADLILAATVSSWRNQSILAKEGGAAEFDQMMAEVAPVVGR